MMADAISDVLHEIARTRRAMLSYSGWSWRAAGYHYDPDDQLWLALGPLTKKLDSLLKEVMNGPSKNPVDRHYCTSLTEYECRKCAACLAKAVDRVEPPTDPSAAEPPGEEAPGSERGGG